MATTVKVLTGIPINNDSDTQYGYAVTDPDNLGQTKIEWRPVRQTDYVAYKPNYPLDPSKTYLVNLISPDGSQVNEHVIKNNPSFQPNLPRGWESFVSEQ